MSLNAAIQRIHSVSTKANSIINEAILKMPGLLKASIATNVKLSCQVQNEIVKKFTVSTVLNI